MNSCWIKWEERRKSKKEKGGGKVERKSEEGFEGNQTWKEVEEKKKVKTGKNKIQGNSL